MLGADLALLQELRIPVKALSEPVMAAGWCDRCGGSLAAGGHEACAGARTLEPPRCCPLCRRRLTVQVLPAGWTAACIEHGVTTSS